MLFLYELKPLVDQTPKVAEFEYNSATFQPLFPAVVRCGIADCADGAGKSGGRGHRQRRYSLTDGCSLPMNISMSRSPRSTPPVPY